MNTLVDTMGGTYAIRKAPLYKAAIFVWAAAAAVGVVAAYGGNAEPFVSASQLPSGGLYMVGIIVALWILGGFVIHRLRTFHWKAVGRAAGLTPDGIGLVGEPDLTGTVGGRQVRARTRTKTKRTGGEGTSEDIKYTVVEADLAGPADRGLVVGRSDGSGGPAGAAGVQAVDVGDGITAVGADEAFAREVLDRRSRDAIRAMGTDEDLNVGDAEGMMQSVLDGAMDDSGGGGFFANALAGRAFDEMAGDASTVSLEEKGLLLHAGELESRAQVVAAVADAFEDATGDGA